MSKRVPKLLAVGAVGAALLVAGCGDDDEDSGDSGATGATGAADVTPIPAGDWTSQADEICATENQAIDEAAQAAGLSDQSSDAEIESFSQDTVVPSLQAQHDAVAALPPPEGEEGTVEELLTALQQGIDAYEADPLGTIQDDSAFDEANSLAQELGLKECGES